MGASETRKKWRERYRIVVRGEFGELLTAAFAELTIQTGDGQTALVTPAIDQSQLQGLLDRLLGFACEIVSLCEQACSSGGED